MQDENKPYSAIEKEQRVRQYRRDLAELESRRAQIILAIEELKATQITSFPASRARYAGWGTAAPATHETLLE